MRKVRFAARDLRGETCNELLARRNLHRETYLEKLASNDLHRDSHRATISQWESLLTFAAYYACFQDSRFV